MTRFKAFLKENDIAERLKNEASIIILSLVIGVSICAAAATRAYSDTVVSDLSQKFIRFHVLANSDLNFDQELKLKVRDAVLEDLNDDIAKCRNISETRALLRDSFQRIKRVAEKTITSEGYDYEAVVSLENVMFPTRTYGDVTLVAGMYEALRIEIGEADGKNWWCVVYPPLCYIDVAQERVSEKSTSSLKDDLTEEQYKFVVPEDDISVKIKFRLVEIWQERKLALLDSKH